MTTELAFTRHGSNRYIVTDLDGTMLGVVTKVRHQSPRTYATGWRWTWSCRILHTDPSEHGFETRKLAAAALVRHVTESKEVGA